MNFRETAEDTENIAKICLKHSCSKTEAVQLALKHTVGIKPPLVITPAMASPKDLKLFHDDLSAYIECLEYLAEAGLPTARPDNSPADIDAIAGMRVRFSEVYHQTIPMHQKIELFGRLVANLEGCEIEIIKSFAMAAHKRCGNMAEALKSPQLDGAKRTSLENELQTSRALLKWLVRCGLVRP